MNLGNEPMVFEYLSQEPDLRSKTVPGDEGKIPSIYELTLKSLRKVEIFQAHHQAALEQLERAAETLDLNALLQLQFETPHQNRAFTEAVNEIIRERWRQGKFLLWGGDVPLDERIFEGEPMVQYEFMPTQVGKDPVLKGFVPLRILFPKGCKEAEVPHQHPGGRIVFVKEGKGFFEYYQNGQHYQLALKPGMIVLMPAKFKHNFSAGGDEDMLLVSIHTEFAGTEGNAIQWLGTSADHEAPMIEINPYDILPSLPKALVKDLGLD